MIRKTQETATADFLTAMALLVRRVRAASASQGISLSEASVMSRLSKDGPATTAELARAESVKPQSMGATVASLEEMGMVTRKPHPTDGRQVHIELTPKGVTTRQDAHHAKLTWLVLAVAQLDASEQQTLFLAGDIIRRLVQK